MKILNFVNSPKIRISWKFKHAKSTRSTVYNNGLYHGVCIWSTITLHSRLRMYWSDKAKNVVVCFKVLKADWLSTECSCIMGWTMQRWANYLRCDSDTTNRAHWPIIGLTNINQTLTNSQGKFSKLSSKPKTNSLTFFYHYYVLWVWANVRQFVYAELS